MTDPRKPAFAGVIETFAAAGLANPFNDPGNVHAFHNLLDAWGAPREARDGGDWMELAAPLIERFEGMARMIPGDMVEAYPDPGTGGEPWTIGIGSTTDEEGRPVRKGDVWTVERARKRFRLHLAEFGEGVDRALAGKPATAAQKAALVALAYNIGLSAFSRSTVLKRHRAGDYAGAANAFAMWNKAGGRELTGLTRRRAAEAELYRKGSL